MNPKAQAEIKPGDVLGGKYRIERVIGQGGMGIVAAARHTELHQRVAIKVLPSHLTPDDEIVERFMREARAAARLRSEHAVKVVDVGARSNGSPYIVMELLDGEDLGAVSERGPLPIASAVDYILQACEAVAEAHALGILHRDLKPRNLFLTTKLHGKPLVKVLDFGLAKSMHMEERALTATATAMGSPQYMSPEQMKAARDIDVRTDIWSLGVCLYELVSAHVPFDSPSVPVLCAMVLKDEPTPLPSLRPDVPPALWAIIQTCLKKARAERFSSVSELAAALEPFAPPEAQGAGLRIAAVLNAVPRGSGHPGMLASGAERVHEQEPERDKTRIAAAFDPRRDAPRGGSSAARHAAVAWLTTSAFVVLAVIGVVLMVRARRGPVAREAALYEPDVATLASAPPRAKIQDASDPASDPAHMVATAGAAVLAAPAVPAPPALPAVPAVALAPAVPAVTTATAPTSKVVRPPPAAAKKPDPAGRF